jgi:hypothetical protein
MDWRFALRNAYLVQGSLKASELNEEWPFYVNFTGLAVVECATPAVLRQWPAVW